MKRILCFFILFINFGCMQIGSYKIKGQNNTNLEKIIVMSKKTSFEFDSNYYPFTLYFNSIDSDFFVRENYNEVPDDAYFFRLLLTKHGETKNYMLDYKYDSSDVDTLVSYFPLLNCNDSFNKVDKQLFLESSILPMYPKVDSLLDLRVEVQYSYILDIMKEPFLYTNNNAFTLRITRRKGSNNTYQSITIKCYTDSTVLSFSEISMRNNIEYEIDKKFSKKILKRENQRIQNLIKKIDLKSEPIDCVTGEGWLVEIKEKSNYFILLRDFPDNCRKCKDTAGIFVGLSYYLNYLAYKYTPYEKEKSLRYD